MNVPGPIQRAPSTVTHSNVDMTDRVDHAIAVLNELIALDREALERLVENRVPCKQALADHLTAQVMPDTKGQSWIGMLGVLNGIFGVDDRGLGYIAGSFDDNGVLTHFMRTTQQVQQP